MSVPRLVDLLFSADFISGDFVEGTKTTADPYIQLLPLTNVGYHLSLYLLTSDFILQDTANAHQDFVKARMNGVDTSSGQPLSAAKSTVTVISRTVIIIIAVAGSVGLLALGLLIFCCCRISKNKTRKTAGGPSGAFGAYRPLDAPAPGGINSYPPPQNASGPYAPQQPFHPGGQQPYSSPWDARP